MATKKQQLYVCQECGSENAKWFGRCPDCNAWNSAVLETRAPAPRPAAARWGASAAGGGADLRALAEVELTATERIATGHGELDLVLGGGIVPGSLVLIGGEPGIGKSTLLLQALLELSRRGLPTVYVSGEESAAQIRLRAERLGAIPPQLLVLCETDLDTVGAALSAAQPAVCVIDSIQTLYRPDLPNAPGSVSQVRECALALLNRSKRETLSTFLVGHVTKDGAVAGPRVLEHMVDAVLYMEGERYNNYRLLRAVKNRFGSTNEIGLFEMRDSGLHEVPNPSAALLAERADAAPGSAVVPVLEGTRALLVEVQALVSKTSYAVPQRVTTGLDAKRLAVLLAVLEKRVGLSLAGMDVFVNVAGGFRLDEPGADLAVVLAVASSWQNAPLVPGLVAIGEVGLSGEIRSVGQIDKRLSEAARLGFGTALVPRGVDVDARSARGLRIVRVEHVETALRAALGEPVATHAPMSREPLPF
jgi:DNA repair protein RadA/Sms